MDVILSLIEEDEEIVENQPSNSFSCDQCDKVYKTQRALIRHKNTKHKRSNVETDSSRNGFIPENILNPLKFKIYIQNSVSKLALDECYSEKTQKEFANYEVTVDDANYSYQFIGNVLGQFKGNAEKFYPAFYKSVSEVIMFKKSRRISVILGFEVENHVLAHLTGSTVKESTVEFTQQVNFTSKEENIIKYLSGYVFGTLYRQIRRSNSSQTMFGVQSLYILLAGKSSLEENSNNNDILIRAKDRGGLWTITPEYFMLSQSFVLLQKIFNEVSTARKLSLIYLKIQLYYAITIKYVINQQEK